MDLKITSDKYFKIVYNKFLEDKDIAKQSLRKYNETNKLQDKSLAKDRIEIMLETFEFLINVIKREVITNIVIEKIKIDIERFIKAAVVKKYDLGTVKNRYYKEFDFIVKEDLSHIFESYVKNIIKEESMVKEISLELSKVFVRNNFDTSLLVDYVKEVKVIDKNVDDFTSILSSLRTRKRSIFTETWKKYSGDKK